MNGLIAETLRADRDERNAAGIHDHWDDPANQDHSEPAVEETVEPLEPVRCGKRLYRVPVAGNVHGFRWVRCDLLLDEFGDCPECDR